MGRAAADTTAELTVLYPDHAELIAAYVPRWLETIPGPMPGMIELVEALDAARVPLFAITNFSAEFWPRFRATAPVFDRFRDILVSGEVGLVKPDPAIYALAIERFGVVAADCVFIDDRAENVAGAVAAGMTGIVFTDAADTRARLEGLGLLR